MTRLLIFAVLTACWGCSEVSSTKLSTSTQAFPEGTSRNMVNYLRDIAPEGTYVPMERHLGLFVARFLAPGIYQPLVKLIDPDMVSGITLTGHDVYSGIIIKLKSVGIEDRLIPNEPSDCSARALSEPAPQGAVSYEYSRVSFRGLDLTAWGRIVLGHTVAKDGEDYIRIGGCVLYGEKRVMAVRPIPGSEDVEIIYHDGQTETLAQVRSDLLEHGEDWPISNSWQLLPEVFRLMGRAKQGPTLASSVNGQEQRESQVSFRCPKAMLDQAKAYFAPSRFDGMFKKVLKRVMSCQLDKNGLEINMESALTRQYVAASETANEGYVTFPKDARYKHLDDQTIVADTNGYDATVIETKKFFVPITATFTKYELIGRAIDVTAEAFGEAEVHRKPLSY